MKYYLYHTHNSPHKIPELLIYEYYVAYCEVPIHQLDSQVFFATEKMGFESFSMLQQTLCSVKYHL